MVGFFFNYGSRAGAELRKEARRYRRRQRESSSASACGKSNLDEKGLKMPRWAAL